MFHAAVVRAAANPYLTAIYESVHGAVLSCQLRSWVDTDSAPLWLRHGGPEHQWALHEPIAAAVAAGGRGRRAGGRLPPLTRRCSPTWRPPAPRVPSSRDDF